MGILLSASADMSTATWQREICVFGAPEIDGPRTTLRTGRDAVFYLRLDLSPQLAADDFDSE